MTKGLELYIKHKVKNLDKTKHRLISAIGLCVDQIQREALLSMCRQLVDPGEHVSVSKSLDECSSVLDRFLLELELREVQIGKQTASPAMSYRPVEKTSVKHVASHVRGTHTVWNRDEVDSKKSFSRDVHRIPNCVETPVHSPHGHESLSPCDSEGISTLTVENYSCRSSSSLDYPKSPDQLLMTRIATGKQRVSPLALSRALSLDYETISSLSVENPSRRQSPMSGRDTPTKPIELDSGATATPYKNIRIIPPSPLMLNKNISSQTSQNSTKVASYQRSEISHSNFQFPQDASKDDNDSKICIVQDGDGTLSKLNLQNPSRTLPSEQLIILRAAVARLLASDEESTSPVKGKSLSSPITVPTPESTSPQIEPDLPTYVHQGRGEDYNSKASSHVEDENFSALVIENPSRPNSMQSLINPNLEETGLPSTLEYKDDHNFWSIEDGNRSKRTELLQAPVVGEGLPPLLPRITLQDRSSPLGHKDEKPLTLTVENPSWTPSTETMSRSLIDLLDNDFFECPSKTPAFKEENEFLSTSIQVVSEKTTENDTKTTSFESTTEFLENRDQLIKTTDNRLKRSTCQKQTEHQAEMGFIDETPSGKRDLLSGRDEEDYTTAQKNTMGFVVLSEEASSWYNRNDSKKDLHSNEISADTEQRDERSHLPETAFGPMADESTSHCTRQTPKIKDCHVKKTFVVNRVLRVSDEEKSVTARDKPSVKAKDGVSIEWQTFPSSTIKTSKELLRVSYV